METATQGTEGQAAGVSLDYLARSLAAGVSLDYLARSLAALDHDTKLTVLRTADRYTNVDAVRRRIDQDLAKEAYTKASEVLGGPGRTREPFSLDNIEDAFTYKAWDPWQQDQGNQVREALVQAAKVLLRVVPQTPLRTRALNLLFDARMLANAAITHGGRF